MTKTGKIGWLSIILILLTGTVSIEARKIKNSFIIEKGKKSDLKPEQKIEGQEINLADSLGISEDILNIQSNLKHCNFSGYDKEINSNLESFILENNSDKVVTGYKVRIDYIDMKGRMFHSRTVTLPGFVPQGEARRFDIPTWDKQHTYYYYLGNEPKRVATPFQVIFTPLAFWIEN